MKTNNFFLSILFIFAISSANGQENSKNELYLIDGRSFKFINWRPFTIELNSSSVGYGIDIEKYLTYSELLIDKRLYNYHDGLRYILSVKE